MKNITAKTHFLLPAVLGLIVVFTPSSAVHGQTSRTDKKHADMVRSLYDQALTDSRCYNWLEHLCLKIGHRLSGSEAASNAVQWSRGVLDTLGLDSVWLQPVMVPHWVRGEAEQVRIMPSRRGEKPVELPALALGGSIATPAQGITAAVVEITAWTQLDSIGEAGIKDKVVFYNRPMDPTLINTFEAYGKAVDQRVSGASRAAAFGAQAVLVRSMGLKSDNFPHTGTLRYDTAWPPIPAAAISTAAAENLAAAIAENPETRVFVKLNCRTLPDVLSYNVIGEIRGTEKPGDIIVVGGHLDSWDAGHGAHDDGAGCVQSMDVLRYFRRQGYQPRHTVRCVLFMNEENGLRGGLQYAAEALRKGERHVLAVESDAGGFTPRSFGVNADESAFGNIKRIQPYLAPYLLAVERGGGGADIGPLGDQGALLAGYKPDSQRYFDFHHTAADTFDAVHRRELELGAASLAAFIYLMDQLVLK